jgi:hypothetical protein
VVITFTTHGRNIALNERADALALGHTTGPADKRDEVAPLLNPEAETRPAQRTLPPGPAVFVDYTAWPLGCPTDPAT